MTMIFDANSILICMTVIAGMYLAFNIGANDVANTMGTAVGSRALTIKRAIIIAAICEFLGAFIIGDEVTRTISNGFVHSSTLLEDPHGFAYGMTAAILATALWLQFATMRGLPVSTTHSIVGAVVGFAILQGGLYDINFNQLVTIFFSWLFSPLMGGVIAYTVLRFILKKIIDTEDPLKQSHKFVPFMIGSVVTILASAFLGKIFVRITPDYSAILGVLAALLLGAGVGAYFFRYVANRKGDLLNREEKLIENERIFARMQFVTACFLAFAHGSNDVANAIGPAAAVISALSTDVEAGKIPLWLLMLGGIGIVVGLAVFGRKVIETVGKSITEITPSRGFAAEFGAALTILVGSILGIPLSTTHVLVGSVVGVGMARGIGGLDLDVIKKIFRSWLITMPLTATISMVFCLLIKLVR